MIPRSGRSAGKGIGYPLQYSWASLVAQLVRNLPAMRETWVRSLDWEHPLKKLYVSGNKIQMIVWDTLTEIKKYSAGLLNSKSFESCRGSHSLNNPTTFPLESPIKKPVPVTLHSELPQTPPGFLGLVTLTAGLPGHFPGWTRPVSVGATAAWLPGAQHLCFC